MIKYFKGQIIICKKAYWTLEVSKAYRILDVSNIDITINQPFVVINDDISYMKLSPKEIDKYFSIRN